MQTLIKNGTIVNEGSVARGSVLIDDVRICKIIREKDFRRYEDYLLCLDKLAAYSKVIDATGMMVMPGVIDTHVHFREPGNGVAGTIESESKAALLGGVTSYMDMPNNSPSITTLELLEQKFQRAAESSYANYSFYLGASTNNLGEIEKAEPKRVCGVKVFMGASTGNLLVDSDNALQEIFRSSRLLIAAHCEDNDEIAANFKLYAANYRDNIPVAAHPLIRSAKACYKSSCKAIEMAVKYGARFHLLHVSTAKELELLATLYDYKAPFVSNSEEYKITAETAPHYLWFNSTDYEKYGNLIKCNPAIKSAEDMAALRKALKDGVLQTVATDHAPHPLQAKMKPFKEAPGGIPLVQYSLVMMLELVEQGVFSLEEVVGKMCHNPALCFRIKDRGFLREGYFADITIFKPLGEDSLAEQQPKPASLCGWSPFTERGVYYNSDSGEKHSLTGFSNRVEYVFVNGTMVVEGASLTGERRALELEFNASEES
ncbi:MAG: dihydroorotase [Bacteroidales bacterium]|nr:dihydroorotase [Bacteroidales bacterium]